jgi:hypothetical protein
VEREPDRLRGRRSQSQLGALDRNTRPNEAGKMCELGVDLIIDVDPIPFIADEEVLIG